MKELYYFTAPWCKSCQNLKPHIHTAQERGVTVHEINIEADPQTAAEYDVMQLPTVIFVQDEAVIERKAGFSESLVLQLHEFIKA